MTCDALASRFGEAFSLRSRERSAHLRPTHGQTLDAWSRYAARPVRFSSRSAGDRRRRRAATAGGARAASLAPRPAGPDDAGCAGSRPSLESAPPTSNDLDSAGRPGRQTRSCAASGPPTHDCMTAHRQGRCRRRTPPPRSPPSLHRRWTPGGQCPSAMRPAAPAHRDRAPG